REELQFKGILLSEGDGISTLRNERVASSHEVLGRMSVMAGVDVGISMEDAYLGALVENVKSGKVPMSAIDDAVRNILYVKFKLGLFENPFVDPVYAAELAHNPGHVELALQSAREGIVLLKNENHILPLKKDMKSIAVIGPVADAPIDQIGDYSPQVVPQDIVTVLEGIKGAVSPSTRVTYVKGCEVIGDELNEINEAVRAARRADIAVMVLGEAGYRTNGEGRDVASLDLTGMQEELLQAVHATGTPVILVLINGRPLSVNFAAENVPGIIEAWMCGEQGGNAVAEVMFGEYNPCGKLPITVPRHSGQLPVYYNHGKNKFKRYIDMTALPLYEFGYGLSYTTYEYNNLRVSPGEIYPGGEVEVSLDVTNTGTRSGSEVVQLYTSDVWSSMTTPVRELKRFEKVALEPGETKTVTFRLLPKDLQMLDIHMDWIVEPGTFEVLIGASLEDIRLRGDFVVKEISMEDPGIPRRRRTE
ncbi:MAG: beta-glucosidase, partial [Bacteroidetes bacterium]